jgi:hypothetical protein
MLYIPQGRVRMEELAGFLMLAVAVLFIWGLPPILIRRLGYRMEAGSIVFWFCGLGWLFVIIAALRGD